MHIRQETRPEFSRMHPTGIIQRLLRGITFGSYLQAGVLEQSLSRQTANRGYDIADFKPYAPGDDTRYLDWRALARLDQPVVRVFESTKDNSQWILIDASKSMDFGSPTKFSAACWAVMDIAAQCWKQGNRLNVQVMSDKQKSPVLSRYPINQITGLIGLIKALAAIRPTGTINIERFISIYAAREQSSTPITIISDFLPHAPALPTGCNRRLNWIRVLSTAERNPSQLLRSELKDMETEKNFFPACDAAAVAAYQSALQNHERAIARLAFATGGFAMDVRV